MKPYALGLYEKALPSELDWDQKFKAAKEAGFDYIEISIDETDAKLERLQWTKEQRAELLAIAHNNGMEFGSMCLSGHRKYPLGSTDPDIRDRSLLIMQQAIELACDLGIHTIQLAGYDVYYEEGTEETEKNFSEGLARAVAMAARAGVCMGFETMETPFMDTCEKAMHYVDAMQSPYLGVYPDLGNLTNASFIYGNTVADDIALAKGHIFAAHLKETVKGAYREIAFSTGTTDFAGGIPELVGQGVRRFVAEMWYVGNPDWKADIAFAHDYLCEKLDVVFS